MRKLKKNLSKIFAAVLSAALIVQPAMRAFASIANGNHAAEEIEAEEGDSGDIALTSLLPLEEYNAYVYMNDYTYEQLKTVKLQTVLDRLVDSSGEPIEIPDDATIVWVHNSSESGSTIYDNHMILDRNDTVNLRYGSFQQMIVGSGKQLDKNNVIYNIYVESGGIYESIDFSFYEVDSETELTKEETQLRSAGNYYNYNNKYKRQIPVTQVRYSSPEHEDGNEYYMNFELDTEARDQFPNIELEVYPMYRFLDFYWGDEELTGAITDKVIDTENLTDRYKGTFSKANTMEDYEDADNLFCFVYKNTDTDTIINASIIELLVVDEATSGSGTLYTYEDGKMVQVSNDKLSLDDDYDMYINVKSDGTGALKYYLWDSYLDFDIDDNYIGDDDYYTVLELNETPVKIVEGSYRSMEQAEKANAKDITDDILGKGSVPYGYLKNFYHEFVDITVFFEDGTSCYFCLDSYGGKTEIEYDPAPTVKDTDPYFCVNEVQDYSSYYIFTVENSYDETLDTLYGEGYQTLLLKDKDADLASLKPKFLKPDGVTVHSGSEQFSGMSVQDFSKGSVFYQVHIGDNLKNYNVTIKKLAEGPKLFVNGPEKREIFLDDYFDNRHDILVANIGDEELTGLKVELIGAKNVGIDEYWNLGGEDNDTLSPFESTYRSKMSNLAKIRLVASSSNADEDGEVKGEIKGKLKISADGQAPVYIELTGYAGNPEIITATLSDAVKYVPYSYVVATDNMHDWNKVTFSVEEGELPEGLELYPATGEIYGVPTEIGEFPITVMASYSKSEFEPSYKELVLTVKENTGKNVIEASDKGYEAKEFVGSLIAGTYDYYLNSFDDQTFVSNGEYREFIDFWFNGEKLKDGVDYEKESGSTRITIKSQTLKMKADRNGVNTIAAEFRVDGDETKELKRTAQNFQMNISGGSNNGNTNNGNTNNGNTNNGNTNNGNTNNGNTNNGNTNNGNTNDSNSDNSNNTVENSNQNNTVPAASGPTSNWQSYQYTDNSWIRDNVGWWLKNSDGTWLANTWALLPYRGTMQWYYIGTDGYMKTGWYQDVDGRWYYLHPTSDGTMGRMYYGWNLIDGKWYYFNEVSDGTKGSLKTNTWIGPYYVDENGVWTE